MSEKPIIKELGLEKYFSSILDSSQEDNSNSKSNSSIRSQVHDNDYNEIERMRGVEVADKFLTQDVARAYQLPQVKVLDALYTPSPFGKKINNASPDQCMENLGGGFFSNKSVRTGVSGVVTPSSCFEKKQLDNEFLKFDPSSRYNSSNKKALSHSTAIKENETVSKPNSKTKNTPVKDLEEVLTKKRTNSLDEADIEMISQMLQQGQKKSQHAAAFDLLGPTLEDNGDPFESDQLGSQNKSNFLDTPVQDQHENDLNGPSTASQNHLSKSSLAKNGIYTENEEDYDRIASKTKSSQFSSKNSQALLQMKSQIQLQSNLKDRLDATAKSTIKVSRESLEKFKNLYEDDNNSEDYFEYFLNSPKETEKNTDRMEIEPTLLITQTQPNYVEEEKQSKAKVIIKKSSQNINKPLNKTSQEPFVQPAPEKQVDNDNDILNDALKLLEESSQNNNTVINDTPDFLNFEFKAPSLVPVNKPSESINKLNKFKDIFEDDFPREENQDFGEPQIKAASGKAIPVDSKKLQGIMNLFEENSQKDVFSFGDHIKQGFHSASNDFQKPQDNLQFFKTAIDENNGVGFSRSSVPSNYEPTLTTGSRKPIPVNFDKAKFFQENTKVVNKEPVLMTGTNKPIPINNDIYKVFASKLEMDSQEYDEKIETFKEEPQLKTASNKPIHINNDKHKDLLSKFEMDSQDDNNNGNNITFGNFNKAPMLMTASNKPILINNDKFNEFMSKLEMDSQESNKGANQTSVNFNKEPVLKTASNNPIQINNEKFNTIASKFEMDSQEYNEVLEALEEPQLRTASNKPIHINNDKYKDLLNKFEMDSQEDNQNNNGGNITFSTFNKEPVLMTGLNKPIQVNNSKYKEFMNKLEMDSPEESNNGSNVAFTNFNKGPVLMTGSNKPIQVNNEKFNEFKNKFEVFSQENSMNLGPSSDFAGFSTGNMKPIPVDYDNQKIKDFFKDEHDGNFNQFNMNTERNANPPKLQVVTFDRTKIEQSNKDDFLHKETSPKSWNNLHDNSNKSATNFNSHSNHLQIKTSNLDAAFRLFNNKNSPKSDGSREKASHTQQPSKFQEKKSFDPFENIGTKKVLTEDIRNKKATSPGINLMGALSPTNSDSKYPSMLKSQADVKNQKKTQAFKFVGGNENTNKPENSNSNLTKIVEEKTEKNNLKRNFNDFKKGVLSKFL